jgi:glycosyltransferase 2 family protein
MSDSVPIAEPLPWAQAWRHPWTLAAAAISFGLLGWVLWRASVSEVWSTLQGADYVLMGACLPVFLIGLIFRALRWRILLSPLGNPPFSVYFRSLSVGYLGNNLLPARGGELVRAYALGRQAGINIASTLGTIVIERLSDALVMFLGLSVLLLATPEIIPASLFRIAAPGMIVLLGVVLVLAALQRARYKVVGIVDMFSSKLPDRWRADLVSVVESFMHGLRAFRSAADALLYFLMTLLIWSADILIFWVASLAFGFSFSLPTVVFLVAIGAVSTMIPALPGYVGTYQFALVSALTFMGVLVGPATAFALSVHGLVWLAANVTGAICAMQIGLKLSQLQSQPAAT